MIKYEIKPSVKLIYKISKEMLVYGDTPILAYILFNIYGYTNSEIINNTNWTKSRLSRNLQKGKEDIKNPIKKMHCDLYLEKIDEKFQIYLGGINKEMLNLQAKNK